MPAAVLFLESVGAVQLPARLPEGHYAPPRGAANTRPKAAGQPKAGPAKRDAAMPHTVSVGVVHLPVRFQAPSALSRAERTAFAIVSARAAPGSPEFCAATRAMAPAATPFATASAAVM